MLFLQPLCYVLLLRLLLSLPQRLHDHDEAERREASEHEHRQRIARLDGQCLRHGLLVPRGVVPPGEVGVGDGVGVGVVFVPGFGLGVVSVPGVELGVTVASPVGVVVGISILVRRPPCSSSPSPGVGVGNPGSVFVML